MNKNLRYNQFISFHFIYPKNGFNHSLGFWIGTNSVFADGAALE